MKRPEFFVFMAMVLLTGCSVGTSENHHTGDGRIVVFMLANLENVHHESITFSLDESGSQWVWLDLKEKIEVTEPLSSSMAKDLKEVFKSEMFANTEPRDYEDFTFIVVNSSGEISKVGFNYESLSARKEFATIRRFLSGLKNSGRFSKGSLFRPLLPERSNDERPGDFDKRGKQNS